MSKRKSINTATRQMFYLKSLEYLWIKAESGNYANLYKSTRNPNLYNCEFCDANGRKSMIKIARKHGIQVFIEDVNHEEDCQFSVNLPINEKEILSLKDEKLNKYKEKDIDKVEIIEVPDSKIVKKEISPDINKNTNQSNIESSKERSNSIEINDRGKSLSLNGASTSRIKTECLMESAHSSPSSSSSPLEFHQILSQQLNFPGFVAETTTSGNIKSELQFKKAGTNKTTLTITKNCPIAPKPERDVKKIVVEIEPNSNLNIDNNGIDVNEIRKLNERKRPHNSTEVASGSKKLIVDSQPRSSSNKGVRSFGINQIRKLNEKSRPSNPTETEPDIVVENVINNSTDASDELFNAPFLYGGIGRISKSRKYGFLRTRSSEFVWIETEPRTGRVWIYHRTRNTRSTYCKHCRDLGRRSRLQLAGDDNLLPAYELADHVAKCYFNLNRFIADNEAVIIDKLQTENNVIDNNADNSATVEKPEKTSNKISTNLTVLPIHLMVPKGCPINNKLYQHKSLWKFTTVNTNINKKKLIVKSPCLTYFRILCLHMKKEEYMTYKCDNCRLTDILAVYIPKIDEVFAIDFEDHLCRFDYGNKTKPKPSQNHIIQVPDNLWIIPCYNDNSPKDFMYLISQSNHMYGATYFLEGKTKENELIYYCAQCDKLNQKVYCVVSYVDGLIYVDAQTDHYANNCFITDLRKELSNETGVLINFQ